jgi:hypothetical protein
LYIKLKEFENNFPIFCTMPDTLTQSAYKAILMFSDFNHPFLIKEHFHLFEVTPYILFD